MIYGPLILTRSLTGDAYHYLAIARRAAASHIYTYDNLHITNGFHPLWQYSLRGLFTALHLQTHEAQAISAMVMAGIAVTLGIVFASEAVIRMTGHYFAGMMLVPGLFYLLVGVHVRTLGTWSALDGMESAFSMLFGGIFFYILSLQMGEAFDVVSTYRALGWVFPFLILSRLDDVFLIPAFLLALFAFEVSAQSRLRAAAWITAPSLAVVSIYLIYNRLTVGAAMPLSGRTKSGFTGVMAAYLTAAVHFPPIQNLESWLTHKPFHGEVVFSNAFRFVEVLYPVLLAGFGAWAIWKYLRDNPKHLILLGLCFYILIKFGYNFLFVHPWHQSGWYYTFAALSLNVMGVIALAKPWALLARFPVVRAGIVTVAMGLMMLCGAQYYASLAYQDPANPETLFWARQEVVREALRNHGVTGIINVDDGITAFLLDMPMMHGFAFATDVEAQRAHTQGTMMSLAYSRGINTIAGLNYVTRPTAPENEAEIRQFLMDSATSEVVGKELDQFDYTLAYYDPVLKMPYISFRPKAKR